jgi:hypothetical protein
MSRLATDQPQFYTLATTLLGTDLMTRYSEEELTRRIIAASQVIDGKQGAGALEKSLEEYRMVSERQTTNPDRRERRQVLLIQLIDAL